jgi:hypothetical protein
VQEVLRSSILSDAHRRVRSGTSHFPCGRSRSLLSFDWRWWRDEIGEAPSQGCSDYNCRNGKSQNAHFPFAFSPDSTGPLSKPVVNGSRRSLKVGGNEHPRFAGLDKLEQPSIFFGRPVGPAPLSTTHFFTVTASGGA